MVAEIGERLKVILLAIIFFAFSLPIQGRLFLFFAKKCLQLMQQMTGQTP